MGYAGYEIYNAAQQRNSEYNYQPAVSPSFPIWVKGEPKPEEYQPNCKQPQSREDADLCAQWAAVAQVTESNRLSGISLQLSLGALIFTIVGTGLLVWTLEETRQTARRELRAYVSVEPQALHIGLANGGAEAQITLTNGGQTPAYNCCHAGNVVIITDEAAEVEFSRKDGREKLGRANPFTLHIGQIQNASVPAHTNFTSDEFDSVANGDKAFYVFGIIFYDDTFGIQRTTRFCYRAGDIELPPQDWQKRPKGKLMSRQEWTMAPFHNDST